MAAIHTAVHAAAVHASPLGMAGDEIDLDGSWRKAWSDVTSATGSSNVLMLVGIIGLILIVVAIVKWIWERRRGGGGQSAGLLWTFIVGGVLAAPNLLLPGVLALVDVLVNAVAKLIT